MRAGFAEPADQAQSRYRAAAEDPRYRNIGGAGTERRSTTSGEHAVVCWRMNEVAGGRVAQLVLKWPPLDAPARRCRVRRQTGPGRRVRTRTPPFRTYPEAPPRSNRPGPTVELSMTGADVSPALSCRPTGPGSCRFLQFTECYRCPKYVQRHAIPVLLVLVLGTLM